MLRGAADFRRRLYRGTHPPTSIGGSTVGGSITYYAPMPPNLRILHVGVGPLGHRILNEFVERRLGRIVAAVDSHPNIAGTQLSKLVPGASPELKVLPSLAEFNAWDEVDAAVVTTSSDLRLCEPTFRDILAHGKAIVSTCEELLYPWLRHKALADRLQEQARKTGGRLLATGVNPGFLMDALPTFVTGVCKSVRSVRVYRIQDASSRRVPFQKKIGAGLDLAQFDKKVAEGTLRHVGLGESIHFLSEYLRIPIERWEEDISPVKAERELSSALGPIHRGVVSGVRQVAKAYSDEKVVIHLEFQAAIGQADPHDRCVIDGEPPLDLVIPGGVHGDTATCAITLNALPRLMEAAPGLHTMATIPPIRVVQG